MFWRYFFVWIIFFFFGIVIFCLFSYCLVYCIGICGGRCVWKFWFGLWLWNVFFVVVGWVVWFVVLVVNCDLRFWMLVKCCGCRRCIWIVLWCRESMILMLGLWWWCCGIWGCVGVWDWVWFCLLLLWWLFLFLLYILIFLRYYMYCENCSYWFWGLLMILICLGEVWIVCYFVLKFLFGLFGC